MNKEYVLPTLYILLKTNNYTLKVRKPVYKKCKRNCGFCDKFKDCIFVQSLVLNQKVSALKSATTPTQVVVLHKKKDKL